MHDDFVHSLILGIDGLYTDPIVIVICPIDVPRKPIERYLGCSGVRHPLMHEGHVSLSVVHPDVEMVHLVETLG